MLMQRAAHAATVAHAKHLNVLVRYTQHTPVDFVYRKLPGPVDLRDDRLDFDAVRGVAVLPKPEVAVAGPLDTGPVVDKCTLPSPFVCTTRC